MLSPCRKEPTNQRKKRGREPMDLEKECKHQAGRKLSKGEGQRKDQNLLFDVAFSRNQELSNPKSNIERLCFDF
jgi:hypothetical protein